MKKIITLLLCLAISLGMVSMVGCGDATFNGNYKEVTEEQQAEFVQAAAEAEQTSISFANGADLSLSVKGKVKNDDVDVNIDASVNLKAVAITAEEKTDYQAELSVKAKVDGIPTVDKIDADVKAYYADETAFANGSVQIGKDADGKIDLKNFISLKGMDLSSLMSMVSGMAGGATSDLPVEQISELLGSNLLTNLVAYADLMSENEESTASIKLLFDLDAKKVKAEIKAEIEDTKIESTIYLVFDEKYNVIAIKVEAKATMNGNDISANFSFKGYNGKVNLPSENDRKDYKDFMTDTELQLKISAIMGKFNPDSTQLING